MSYPVYYVEANDTLPVMFTTYDGGTGASITMTGLAVTDIEIYKDGSITQRSSDAGYSLIDTDGIDIDTTTGLHGFTIDLSDNTDAGFYAVGSWYHVVVNAVTVDAQTVVFIACAFRIVSATRGMAGTALPDAAADAAGGLPISDAGGLDMDAILVDTNSLNDTKVPDTISLANINAQVDTAIADVNLDHLVGTATGIPALPAGTYFDQMLDDGVATYDRTTDSLQAVRDHIGDGTNLTEAGGTGDHLTAIDLPNQTMDITGNITGNLSGSVGSVTGAVGSVTGAVGSVTGNVGGNVVGSVGSLNTQAKADVNAEVDSAFTTQMADSVATDGTIATREQALYQLLQFLTERSVSGTTVTVKKVDGATSLFTLTLDDGTTPTSITRS